MLNELTLNHNAKFQIAWRMLPDPIAARLEQFIWKVQSVDEKVIEGVTFPDNVFCPVPNADEVHGWCAHHSKFSQVCLVFFPSFTELLESEGCYIVLHELAHALECLEDGERAVKKPRELSEAAACAQVVAWAARKSQADSYEHTLAVVKHAVDRSYHHVYAEINLRRQQLNNLT